MIHEVERLGTSQPDLRIKLHVTSDFAPHVQMYERENADVMDADTYSAHMMNARICLAPRGTSPETFRYFEGLRAGCIVITDTMPDHWFYADSPAVEIDDWRTLGEVVLSVLRDPDRLQDMHEKSLQWWDERCSETALAAFITEVIESRIGHGHRSEPAQRLHTTPR